MPDHPHACGENPTVPAFQHAGAGPSPRVWGKPWRPRRGKTSGRTIPTRVGKTPPPCPSHAGKPDHPHACGENAVVVHAIRSKHGPSPRVWGKRRDHLQPAVMRRTIPTRVGKTETVFLWWPNKPDHPHACGENVSVRAVPAMVLGPSPRVWGKPILDFCRSCFSRTIPTRVGKTCADDFAQWDGADHPHACGENPQREEYTSDEYGPSPRVWGKRCA